MYVFKNISNEPVDLASTGIVLEIGQTRSFEDIGAQDIIENAQDIADLIFSDLIIVTDIKGTVYTKNIQVDIVSDSYNAVQITNVTDFNTYKNDLYYFLKDSYRIYRGRKIIKHFRGRVNTLTVISKDSNLNVTIRTGDGIVLPIDELNRREELSFDFNGKVKDLEIEIDAYKNSTTVEIFMEGYSTEDTVEELQDFIDSWYQDNSQWPNLENRVVKCQKFIKDKDLEKVLYDNETKTITIPSKSVVGANKEFVVYRKDDTIIVEYIEWDWEKSKQWNPRKFKISNKNVKYVVFDDKTLDVDVDWVIPWDDRKNDGRHY